MRPRTYPPLIREYGCVKCQKWHRQGFDPEYEPHLFFQSKHGWLDRPATMGERFVLEMKLQDDTHR